MGRAATLKPPGCTVRQSSSPVFGSYEMIASAAGAMSWRFPSTSINVAVANAFLLSFGLPPLSD